MESHIRQDQEVLLKNEQKRHIQLEQGKIYNKCHIQGKIAKKKQKKIKKIKKDKDIDYVLSAACLYQIRETWTQRQDLVFLSFMKENQLLFSTQNLRRSGKVFLRLSKIMGELRTPNHCKSHYQKLQRQSKQGSIKSVIEYMENKYSLSTPLDDQQDPCKKGVDLTMKIDADYEFRQDVQIITYHSKKALQVKIFANFDEIVCW